jgi:hypothetical protein
VNAAFCSHESLFSSERVNPQDSSEPAEAGSQIEARDPGRRALKSDRDRLLDVALFVLGALLSIWWGTMRLSLVVLIAGVTLLAVAAVRAWTHYQERPRSMSRRRS